MFYNIRMTVSFAECNKYHYIKIWMLRVCNQHYKKSQKKFLKLIIKGKDC